MTHTDCGLAEPDSHLKVTAEEASRVDLREQAWRQASAAQRWALSLQRSAESQDRVAKSYEELGGCSERRDEYLQHAARHRRFAQEDRWMAQQLRRIKATDGLSTFLIKTPPDSPGLCHPLADG